MQISKLQYISQGETPQDHLNNIEAVCQAGLKWVQLRLKNIDLQSYIQVAKEARAICTAYQTMLIINDQVAVAQASSADGVHLGQGDLNWAIARKKLGDAAIIGATANTFAQLQHIMNAQAAVNYIGLGPFRYTSTKKNLSPILGLTGYQQLLMQVQQAKWAIPIIAIGGIQTSDIEAILTTGIHGIAVSSLLTKNDQKTMLVEQIHKILGSIAE